MDIRQPVKHVRAMTFENLKYAQRRRLEFLDQLFFWQGRATRASLVQRFDISNAQAALDFRAYLETAGQGGPTYDASSRRYISPPDFRPLTGLPEPSDLWGLLGSGGDDVFDTLPDLARTQSVSVLRSLYRAILAGEAVEIIYQSMGVAETGNPAQQARWIAPVGFASDGMRQHVRAWCFKQGDYRDFVPSRMNSERSFAVRRPADKLARRRGLAHMGVHHTATPQPPYSHAKTGGACRIRFRRNGAHNSRA